MVLQNANNKRLAARCNVLAQRAAMIFCVLLTPLLCAAQSVPMASSTSVVPIATPTPEGTQSAPLTAREQEMLKLIKELQERVTKLESAAKPQPDSNDAAAAKNKVPQAVPISPPVSPATPAAKQQTDASAAAMKPAQSPAADQDVDPGVWGKYTPNLGMKIADTKYGDMSISIYSYVRYLNQLGLNENYTDAFGNVKDVQNRQDFQLTKLQIKFLGWMLDKRLRYFLYAWTSNANQGQGAQVVLAGNLSFAFNKYLTLAGGIRSLPGTRSVEGNFPFWFSPDSRHIADEFFRPSYTNGVWASGQIAKNLRYTAMLGNNLSTLGVSAARIDNKLNTFSGSLNWFPTGEFEEGFSGQGWGDFENHQKLATRLGFHFTRSDENKESQPTSDTFENTQIRLSDGTVIFTPNIFGAGKTVTDVRYRMSTADFGFKYKGYSLEGEYFWRWLDNFRGTNVQGIPNRFDHGYQIQASFMPIKKTLQVYTGTSKIFGEYGNPWDFRIGANWFPFHNHVVRWNNEALYLYKSPVGYTSVPFALGGRGWIFVSTFEFAF